MSAAVMRAAVGEIAVDRREILRYAGGSSDHADTVALMESCLEETDGRWQDAVCYVTLPVTVDGARCDFGAFTLESYDLAAMLKGAKEAVCFAATVGVTLDRLLQKYANTSPSRAMMLQAVGAQRIEAVCDAFCKQCAQAAHAKAMPRFSPGYGDLPLEAQRTLFAVLDPPKHIGVSLCDSLLMTPTKSVTAIAAAGDDQRLCHSFGCSACRKHDCAFRGDL